MIIIIKNYEMLWEILGSVICVDKLEIDSLPTFPPKNRSKGLTFTSMPI